VINFLLWVILIYFALLLFWRYVLPFLLKRYMRKMQQKFDRSRGQNSSQNYGRHEGEVTIEHASGTHARENSPVDESEYVDFEEIINKDPNNH
jgi:hypothetical protein